MLQLLVPDGSALLATNTSRTFERYSAPVVDHLHVKQSYAFATLHATFMQQLL
jgi:hypothetical protein